MNATLPPPSHISHASSRLPSRPCSTPASVNPPLSPRTANPQFILLTNDDSVTQGVFNALTSVTNGRKSLTGCTAAATLFAVGRRDWGQGACTGHRGVGGGVAQHGLQLFLLAAEAADGQLKLGCCSCARPSKRPASKLPAVSPSLPADCALVKKLHGMGYEIADHTQRHIGVSCAPWRASCLPAVLLRILPALPHPATPRCRQCGCAACHYLQVLSGCHLQALRLQLKGLTYAQVEKEISEGRRSLAACGIPAADIVGFRGPLLETDSNTRKALKALGFLYDR